MVSYNVFMCIIWFQRRKHDKFPVKMQNQHMLATGSCARRLDSVC